MKNITSKYHQRFYPIAWHTTLANLFSSVLQFLRSKEY